MRLRVLALALFAAWVLLGNLTPITANDVWLQIKVGADLLRTHSFPQVDVYSAVAAGRPFIAHEWLASVLFHGIHSRFGGTGLSLLQAAVALGCAALLYFSVAREGRQGLAFLPLLTVAMYLVGARLALRPHVFSLLAMSALTFALERWRRSRNPRDLVWLVPLQLVWANTHGEAVVAPGLLALLAALTLAVASFPRLQPAGEPPFRRAEAGQLALVALGLLAVTLMNPYGDRLLWFSLGMGASNDYLKRYVFEWTPTLDPRTLRHWYIWPYFAELALTWIVLLRRLRRRPLWDLSLAAFATILSLSAQRHVPYFAILCFPILVRALPGGRRRPLAEALVGASLALVAVVHGLPFRGAQDGTRTGLGFAPTHALTEVAALRSQGRKGVLFNEYFDGALVIEALWPEVKPVMDSRIDIYGRELYEEYLAAQISPQKFADYLGKYNVDLVMLDQGRTGPLEWLRGNREWRLVLQSERRVVFARDYGQLGEFQSPEQPPKEPQLQAK